MDLPAQPKYVRYRPDIEKPKPDEADTIRNIIETFTSVASKTEPKYGHGLRLSHVKATGLLVGELKVLDGLPIELRQGLFAEPRRYCALLRFAQGPGEILDDKISTHRGVSIKIIEVDGPKIPEDDEARTQDFVMEAGKTFPNADSSAFLKVAKGLAHAPDMPDSVKGAISNTAEVVNKALKTIGLESRKLDFFGHPSRHPLAEAYFSQVPMRFGDYVAKIGLFPSSTDQDSLAEHKIDARDDPDAFRNAVIDYFRRHGAVFELRAQLATSEERMPIEDATVEWPEDESPYRTVGRILIPPQDAYSDARRTYFEDALAFRPAHSLMAHQPIGSVMRARLAVYAQVAKRRHEQTGQREREPRSRDEIPA